MDASHLLSPVRPPTELADERRAISADPSDATSTLSKSQLNGSSLRPLRPSVNATYPRVEESSDEAVWLHSVLSELTNLGHFDL